MPLKHLEVDNVSNWKKVRDLNRQVGTTNIVVAIISAGVLFVLIANNI